METIKAKNETCDRKTNGDLVWGGHHKRLDVGRSGLYLPLDWWYHRTIREAPPVGSKWELRSCFSPFLERDQGFHWHPAAPVIDTNPRIHGGSPFLGGSIMIVIIKNFLAWVGSVVEEIRCQKPSQQSKASSPRIGSKETSLMPSTAKVVATLEVKPTKEGA